MLFTCPPVRFRVKRHQRADHGRHQALAVAVERVQLGLGDENKLVATMVGTLMALCPDPKNRDGS